MITRFDIIYYTIYIITLFLSFKARVALIPGLSFLRFMLCFGLGTEITVEILEYLKMDSNPPYYIYIPVEYYCLVQFYIINTINIRTRKFLHASLPFYFIGALLLSIFYNRFSSYPSVIYNISCFLNCIWISLLLFNFNMGDGKRIWKHPLFIILSAYLIFFSGVFFFNTTYSYLLKKDSTLADDLRNYTNITINYILYILLSYGFICSASTRKY